MGRQKQNSIVKYVANYFFALLMLLAFVMLCFVVFLSKQLTYSSIRREMSIELRQNAKYMHVKGDGYVLDEEFQFQDSEYTFVILDDKGKLLQGVYPQNFPADLEVNSGKLRTIKVNGTDYYFQDRQSLHSPLAIRCVIEQSKADCDYNKFVYLTWGFVLFILGISVGMWKLLERREMRQINQVVEMAGKIGREKSLSRRIEYNGRFAEIVSLVQANNRMLGQLQEMFETQKRFTSDVAHELRTPITVLMAECEYAGQKIQKEGEVWEAFQVIERQISKMNCIIVQMLNLSRLDQDKMKLNREWIDLGEIVDSVCDDISFQDTKQV